MKKYVWRYCEYLFQKGRFHAFVFFTCLNIKKYFWKMSVLILQTRNIFCIYFVSCRTLQTPISFCEDDMLQKECAELGDRSCLSGNRDHPRKYFSYEAGATPEVTDAFLELLPTVKVGRRGVQCVNRVLWQSRIRPLSLRRLRYEKHIQNTPRHVQSESVYLSQFYIISTYNFNYFHLKTTENVK